MTCKVSKQWVQNCKRSCAHKIPMLNVDGWTDRRTYGQTDGNLHAYVFLLKQVQQKVTKIDPTIMSNPHAHPHTMRKTHAKFQNNWYKTVRGVALTRDALCLYNPGEKRLSSQCRKSEKN